MPGGPAVQLSCNFYLYEFERSQTAARFGIENRADAEVIDNLKRLCADVLQPLRDETGMPITVTSGYRSRELNRRIGGSHRSAHCEGRAADIVIAGMAPLQVCEALQWNMQVDQLIHEFGEWAHVAIARDGDKPRCQMLTAVHEPGHGTRYRLGLEMVA